MDPTNQNNTILLKPFTRQVQTPTKEIKNTFIGLFCVSGNLEHFIKKNIFSKKKIIMKWSRSAYFGTGFL